MGGPSFFDQGNEQGAGFLQCAQAEGAAGGGVGVTLDGGVGGDDQDAAGFRGCAGGCGAGLDDAQHGDGDGLLNGVKSQGAGGVAGNDQKLGVLLLNQEPGALGGIAGDGAPGLGAVGKPGGVANEGETGLGKAPDEGAKTVSPPKPESKTPMVGGVTEAIVSGLAPGWLPWGCVTGGFLRMGRRRWPDRCG